MVKCRKQVWSGTFHSPCSRNAVKDGYCKQHHPVAYQKREKAALDRYKAKTANSPAARLGQAQDRIRELEAERAEMWEWIKKKSFTAMTGHIVVRVEDLKGYLEVKESCDG